MEGVGGAGREGGRQVASPGAGSAAMTDASRAQASELALKFIAFSAEIIDLAISLIPLFPEEIAFGGQGMNGRWDIVIFPLLDCFQLRDSLITFMLGPNQMPP
jgi:hypothetical protein